MSGTLFEVTLHVEALQVFTPLTLGLLEFSDRLCDKTVVIVPLNYIFSPDKRNVVWDGANS
jgi:hypothetical protein